MTFKDLELYKVYWGQFHSVGKPSLFSGRDTDLRLSVLHEQDRVLFFSLLSPSPTSWLF